MEEPQNHHQHHHHRRSGSSRLGLKNAGGGEIVEVQGGHIVRSTGRKDRHSKVCTAKGTRDRRVRLAAHTAIQFYDVQDRLGYDRPSKAVDWLIKKAKAAIDELEELPAWNPITNSLQNERPHELHEHHQQQLHNNNNNNMMVDVNENLELDEKRHQHHHHDEHVHNNNMVVGGHVESSSFLPPSMDSDAIADTIKSFFPVGGGSSGTTSSVMEFQSQDLRLSLQSFQDPVHLHHHQPPPRNQTPANQTEQTLLGFDTNSSWSDHHQAEIARFQRMVAWNSGGGGGGFIFDSPPPQPPPPQPLLGQTQFFSQRGPLQSSDTPSVRAWIDPYSSTNHHHHQSSVSGGGFASGGGFSGFRIPARIQGEDEEHDGISDKPSSASSDSRH